MRAVAWSSAGLIATAGANGEIHLWTDEGDYLTTWQGHGESVATVEFDRAGSLLVSAGADRTIRLWDTATGRCLHVLTGHEGYVSKVVFSPDGRRLASSGQHHAIMSWDTVTGKRLYSIDAYDSAAGPILYTPDGNLLITGGGDHYDALHVRDARTGELITVLRSGHLGGVTAPAITPDGRHLVAALGNEVATVYDLATRSHIGTFAGHSGYLTAVACHADNQTVVTGGDDRTIRLWRIGEQTSIGQFTGHTQGIGGLAFDVSGDRLLSGSIDGTARVWRLDGTTMKMLIARRPYEGIDITGAIGLNEHQRDVLRALGARDTLAK
ncbi:hypothetical protein JOF56_007375 [Kibdelosporangium banguiense]|uniref:WD40 repeat domain-containing protein n=1 Tax=Kibdelosporangium banguiense TaxID=1365924 RepID=A0ABS4TSR6_9PSEU|nr:WD40 repeat domain-containing protein [Kibdelosporangium banguiense]MBP2326990.1 hypothetical protein [Kibdelosporangium banguiense]